MFCKGLVFHLHISLTGQEQMPSSYTQRRFMLDVRTDVFSLKGWLSIGMSCPRKWWRNQQPRKCSRNDCMWHLVLWSSWHGSVWSKVGFNDLGSLFQLNWFYDINRLHQSLVDFPKWKEYILCSLFIANARAYKK